MDKTASAITVAEALSWLIPLIGGGGLTAIVVAWLGTRKPHPLEPQPGPLGIQALLADHYAIDNLTRQLDDMNRNLEGISRGINRYCDLMDIAKAVGRLNAQGDE